MNNTFKELAQHQRRTYVIINGIESNRFFGAVENILIFTINICLKVIRMQRLVLSALQEASLTPDVINNFLIDHSISMLSDDEVKFVCDFNIRSISHIFMYDYTSL